MEKRTKGYYSCKECGALFEAEIKQPGKQQCSVCGRPPTGDVVYGPERSQILGSSFKKKEAEKKRFTPRVSERLHGVNHDSLGIYESTVESMTHTNESGRVQRKKRSIRKKSRMARIVLLWLVVMGAVVYFLKFSGEDEVLAVADHDNAAEIHQRELAEQAKQRELAVQAAFPACKTTMAEFLRARSVEEKSQFVYRGVSLLGKMTRYYRDTFDLSRHESKFRVVRAELLTGFEMETLGALFVNDRGEMWEAIFVRDHDDWKIDWESFVRYDERSWSLFPAESDGEEGEFRLYMRVRDTNEDLEQKTMSLVFYKPETFFKGEFNGIASAPVSVVIDSDLGRRIKAMLAEEKERGIGEKDNRKDAHGLSLSKIDPERYHRVRVKIKVHKVGKDKKKSKLELLEILAEDWYGIENSTS